LLGRFTRVVRRSDPNLLRALEVLLDQCIQAGDAREMSEASIRK
jgi:hypothetical protein